MYHPEHCQSLTVTIFGHLTNSLVRGSACKSKMLCADGEDIYRGAHYIPRKVSEARGKGEQVTFTRKCRYACCWYWQMEDGTKIFHIHTQDSRAIAEKHEGICPYCENVHTNGETVPSK